MQRGHLDERAGTMLTRRSNLKARLPVSIYLPRYGLRSSRKIVASNSPELSESPTVDAIFAHANAEHRKSVALMKSNRTRSSLKAQTSQARVTSNAVGESSTWLLLCNHSQLARKRGDETCANNGQWDVRSAISANDDASLVADDDTVVTAVSNVFAPDEEEQESFEHSVFYCRNLFTGLLSSRATTAAVTIVGRFVAQLLQNSQRTNRSLSNTTHMTPRS